MPVKHGPLEGPDITGKAVNRAQVARMGVTKESKMYPRLRARKNSLH